jgi:uncharacterized coiled-coil protein SlyX
MELNELRKAIDNANDWIQYANYREVDKHGEAIQKLRDLAEKVLKIQKAMPEKRECDHPCVECEGSNCSVWLCNNAHNDAINQCTLAVAGMLAEKDKKIEGLRDDVAKLNTYGDTYKQDYHDMKDERDELSKKIAELERELAEQRELYNELIMAVGNKYKDETRHQTALRYIIMAENENSEEM